MPANRTRNHRHGHGQHSSAWIGILAVDTGGDLKKRAARGSRKDFEAALARAPDVEPEAFGKR